MKYFDCLVELDARVEYQYTPPTSARYSDQHGNWLPGDAPELSNVRVLVQVPFKALQDALLRAEKEGATKGTSYVEIDVYGALGASEANNISDECLEHAGGN